MSRTQGLSEFFREKRERADAENVGVDWSRKRAEWVEAIATLYQQVRELLVEPLSQGLVQLTTRPKTIVEAHLGQYEVDELILVSVT